MTITTYTDREIALRQQLATMTATATEYKRAADKMAWDHNVVDALQAESHNLRQQLAAATQLAQLNGEIAAELKANKLALEAAIEASKLFAAPVVAPDVLKDAERMQWLDKNTTFMDVDQESPVALPNVPVLAAVSSRIWYHATDDITSYPLSAVVDAAMGGAND